MANASEGSWRLQKAERFMTAAALAYEAADYETSVSRAYYAAHHAVIAMFETRMGTTRPRWAHNPYFDRFSDLESLRTPLRRLYAGRVRADYEEGTFDNESASELLAAARSVIDQAAEVASR